MTQHYSDPSRETDLHAIPDLEVWEAPTGEYWIWCDDERIHESSLADRVSDAHCKVESFSAEPVDGGWFYWFCFPGCLPDNDANGPFSSEAEALADARAT